MCFTELRQPGVLFRAAALLSQGLFWNTYFVAYLLSPAMCHRFVGYLEEEAVSTYTHAIEAYDQACSARGRARPRPTWQSGAVAMHSNAFFAVLLGIIWPQVVPIHVPGLPG